MIQTTNQAINDKPCFGFWGCSMFGQTSQIRRNPDLPQGLLQLLSDVHLASIFWKYGPYPNPPVPTRSIKNTHLRFQWAFWNGWSILKPTFIVHLPSPTSKRRL